jgi:dethiobiotin synthetase
VPAPLRGLLVTGTDTGAGKTVVAAALLAAMAAAGEPVVAHKPVVTGLDDARSEDGAPSWPPDHELLAAVSGSEPAQVSPLRFGPAVSPHLAAALAGSEIDPSLLVARARSAGADGRTLVVEGVGGLLVPLSGDFSVRDLAVSLGLPLVVAARPALGTINHTLLTLEAARSADLDVAAVVLTPWPQEPCDMELSNRETIAALGEVEVETLSHIPVPSPEALAAAGARLRWRRWL